MSYTYQYPRPAVTVDCVIFYRKEVLLIKRGNPPFEGLWAFPGGFVDMDELLIDAAYRELEEETGIRSLSLNPFRIFDKPDRDPRGRTISMVYIGFLNDKVQVKAADDAVEAEWFPVSGLPELAFDHREILDQVLQEFVV